MELIKIQEKDGKQLVSARELHTFLGVRTPFKDWIQRMIEYGFVEGVDFSSFLSKSTGGRPSKEYALTLDMAKEISMIQRTEKGKQARQYFISCEKKLRDVVQLEQPNNGLSISELDNHLTEAMALTSKIHGDKENVLRSANAIVRNKTGEDILELAEYKPVKLPPNATSTHGFSFEQVSNICKYLEELQTDKVCVAQIWVEALGYKLKDMNRYTTRNLNKVLRTLYDWREANTTKKFGKYGIQKYYKRV